MAGVDLGTAVVLQGYRFSIELEGSTDAIAYASEISGIDAEFDQGEYRSGNDTIFTTRKYPGLAKYGNITVKQCMIKDNDKFYQLVGASLGGDGNSTHADPSSYKKKMTINMLGPDGATVATWTISNAWAVKYTGPDLNSTSSDISVETIEFAHEGIVRGTGA